MKTLLQKSLFAHKWILLVFYWGLVLALMCYGVKYLIFIWELLTTFISVTENDMMLLVLRTVDVVMVANLVVMIVRGSYQVFIEKVKDSTEKVTSGILKVKMGTSLIGITSIHLLQVFIQPPKDNRDLFIKVGVHIVFLISGAMLALINYWDSKAELNEANSNHIEQNEKD